MTTRIYMMRHGQALFNVLHKIQGGSDSPLTAKGIRQAEIARDHFEREGITFDVAYASTSERASDTLEIILGQNKGYHRLKSLKEWNFGTFEAESEHLNPPLPYGDFFAGYQGEREADVRNRISKAVKNIADNHLDQTILIVSHGGAIAQFFKDKTNFEGSISKDIGFTNCSALIFDYQDGEFEYKDVLNHDYSQLSD
ncbi:histidine phosphatase family protein [Aerococcus viridans]|uniref:Histidine phosphatase family protein n=1 Tax=Aerococcus viridans TaxID=1377 RepID=A0A2N6UD14_9LACT|nr:histidine phosphatase family protein [Aerococcus viridans]PMC79450.1 histidine phosphatase family protein [Aerococcus viridans]